MKNYYWLILIIIIASFFRLWNIASTPPGFYPDEAMNGNNAVEAWDTNSFKIFYPENNGREGLWINMMSPFIAALGHEPWVSRGMAAVFGILTVVGLYFLVRELFQKEKLALFSAFLLATGFWHINFSRIGFRAILAPFFLTWAIFLLLLVVNKIKKGELKNLKLLAALGGLIYGLGFHTYIAYRATPLLMIVIFYWLYREVKDSAWFGEFMAAAKIYALTAFIVALPLGVYFLGHPQDFLGRTAEISVTSSSNPMGNLLINALKTAGMFNFSGDGNWRHNYSGSPELFWPVGLLFVIGLLLLFKKSLNKEWSYMFVISWLIITALPVIASNEGIPHALRAIIMTPAVYLTAGLGGFWLYNLVSANFIKAHVQLKATTYLFLGLLVIQAYISYFVLWAKNPEVAGAFTDNYVKIARELNKLPLEKPKVIIVKAGGVDVRGIPMPAETVMFLTDTFEIDKRQVKNFYYLTPETAKTFPVPKGAYVVELK